MRVAFRHAGACIYGRREVDQLFCIDASIHRSPNHDETRHALSRFWLRARRESRGLVILSKRLLDAAMGQNSCQPEGLQPKSAMAALLVLAIERLLPSPGALPPPIL